MQHTDKSFANSNVSFDFEVASDDIDPDGDRDGYYEWNYEMKKADTGNIALFIFYIMVFILFH